MSKSPSLPQGEKKTMIRVLIVDDIPETRENLKKLLAFEPDIDVVGTASTGREGLEAAIAKKPDIILMDINMPDMDGISATEHINKAVPTAGVVMMSVQSEADYLRRAMLAGARDFLTKPIAGDELYATVRRVYDLLPKGQMLVPVGSPAAGSGTNAPSLSGGRDGKVIVVYSPQGGAGKTTVSSNLAAAMMRENAKILLIDCDLQFGDIGVFLNLQGQNTITELSKNAGDEDLDIDLVENVLVKHDSGLKVLLAPLSPEDAESIVPDSVVSLILKLRDHFDFIVVDTSSKLDELNLNLFDIASKILLVTNPTLPALKNTRIMLNLFATLRYPEDKVQLVFNRVNVEFERTKVVPPVTAFEQRLKRTGLAQIPSDEKRVLTALTRGTPIISTKDRGVSPVKEFFGLADSIRGMFDPVEATPVAEKPQTNGRLSSIFGKR
jgi:pilus assembly protein CpaE